MGDVINFIKCKNFKGSKRSGDNSSDGPVEYSCPGLDKLATRLDYMSKIIAGMGTIIGLILTIYIFASNVQYTAIKDTTNANMQAIRSEITNISQKIDNINQHIDEQEKLNSMQIQRDVIIEVHKQKTNK